MEAVYVQDETHRVVADIHSAALCHNVMRIRALMPGAKMMAMLKANAYGHGLLTCAPYLKADYFGVATLDEARSLRKVGLAQPIVLMSGFHTKDELNEAHDLDLESVVYHPFQLDILSAYRGAGPIPVWFKVDTGMHRLGCPIFQAESFLRRLEKISCVAIQAVMSHLACADEANHPHTLQQLERFSEISHYWHYPKSILNSAGIFHYPDFSFDIVRPGLALYGASPLKMHSALALGLEAVMTLKSRLVLIQELQAGEGVGYGCDWVASRPSRIASISIGYGDGYPQRAFSAKVSIRNQLCPVVGRVSMDFLNVDITDAVGIDLLDEVILWGGPLPVAEVAQAIGVSVYPLLTGVMARVPRRILSPSLDSC